MTTGLQSGGADLDTLFAARANAKRADVGWLSNSSVDISNRFEQRGGSTARANTGLQSAAVDLSQLFRDISLGAVGAVSIVDDTLNATIGGTSASCRYWLGLDGAILGNKLGFGNTLQNLGFWITPQTGMTDYDAMATIVSGTLEAGSAGVWEQLGITNILYANIQSVVGSSSCTIDVSIRRRADGVVLDTARIAMSSTRSS